MNDSAVRARPGCFQRWKLALLTAGPLFGSAAVWLGSSSEQGRPDVAPVLSASDLDVGEVWEQSAFPCKLTVQNTSPKDVVIEDFRSSCGCLSVEPSKLTIPAGGKAEVRATLNLKLPPGRASMDFEVQIVPILRDELQPAPPWTIRGRLRRVLELKPPKVSFYGTELVEDQPFPSQTVVAAGKVPLDSLAARCSPDLASVRVTPSKHRANEFEIAIIPARTLPAGPFRFEIVLEPKRNGAGYPSLPLAVEGRIASDVRAFPDSLVLGPGKAGETLSDTVNLQSASGAPFEVEKVESDSQGVAVEAVTGPGLVKTFRIAQKVKTVGTDSSSVRFSVRKKNGRSSTVIVRVVCLGIGG